MARLKCAERRLKAHETKARANSAAHLRMARDNWASRWRLRLERNGPCTALRCKATSPHHVFAVADPDASEPPQAVRAKKLLIIGVTRHLFRGCEIEIGRNLPFRMKVGRHL